MSDIYQHFMDADIYDISEADERALAREARACGITEGYDDCGKLLDALGVYYASLEGALGAVNDR